MSDSKYLKYFFENQAKLEFKYCAPLEAESNLYRIINQEQTKLTLSLLKGTKKQFWVQSTTLPYYQGKELYSFDQLGRPKSIRICRSGFDYDDQMDWNGLVSITKAQAKERGRADVHRNFYAQVRFSYNSKARNLEVVK